MNFWHEIDPGTEEEIHVIIEINRGSKNKYEIDKKTGLIALDRALHTAQDYPVDYGFVPKSLWDDGDALDVIVLTSSPLSPSILVRVRPVGILEMDDSGESDDKLIGVPVGDPRFDDVKDVGDINKHFLKEISHFFETYKQLQGKTVKIKEIKGKEDAKKAFRRSLELYKSEFTS